MENLKGAVLQAQARRNLEGKQARKLAAVHAGVSLGVALLLTVLQYILEAGMGNTSGLSGMSTRALLETGQTLLVWAHTVLTPFWSLGFLYAALRWARNSHARTDDLLTGFRRFGPYLRLMLLKGLLMVMLVFFCVNLSSLLYMMTQSAQQIMAIAGEVGTDPQAIQAYLYQLSEAELMGLLQTMAPFLIFFLIISAALLIPILYRLRLAEYVILDQPGMGALMAMGLSMRMTRGNCVKLLSIDLRLWWYYGLQVLCMVLCYGDVILGLAGVQLPVNATVLYLVFYGVYLIAQFGVSTLFRPQVETTYACAYEVLRQRKPEEPKPVKKPRNLPWDEA